MRAAKAAKNTAELIRGTVKKIKEGADLVTKTNEAFGQMVAESCPVGRIVAEICRKAGITTSSVSKMLSRKGLNQPTYLTT